MTKVQRAALRQLLLKRHKRPPEFNFVQPFNEGWIVGYTLEFPDGSYRRFCYATSTVSKIIDTKQDYSAS